MKVRDLNVFVHGWVFDVSDLGAPRVKQTTHGGVSRLPSYIEHPEVVAVWWMGGTDSDENALEAILSTASRHMRKQ